MKKVKLKAKTGNVNECCPNGSAETGTYGGWTGGDGEIKDFATITNTTINPNNTQHSIITSDAVNTDFYSQGGVPLISPTGSNYFIKLGDDDKNSYFSKMQYCIDVKECNQDFVFNYAVVLENDPTHSPKIQPYFTWNINNTQGQLLEAFPHI